MNWFEGLFLAHWIVFVLKNAYKTSHAVIYFECL